MYGNEVSSELLWDNHIDDDLGDLLDLIMKNSSTHDVFDRSHEVKKIRRPETDLSLSVESLSLEGLECIPKYENDSLLRRIQTHVDLRPGFPCTKSILENVHLTELIHRQLIIDEIRSKLDASTIRVYARRHDKSAALRRVDGRSFFVPKRRGIEIPSSYLALIEKMNPMLFSQIHDGGVNQLPKSPDDLQYLSRLGQFIDIFERVFASDSAYYNSEEAYALQMEYDRVYDLLFTNTKSMTFMDDNHHS